jgi:hypothetical protein
MDESNAAASVGGPLAREAIEGRPEIETNWRDFDPEDDAVILANIAKNAAVVTGISSNKNVLLPMILRERTLDKSDAGGKASELVGEEQYAQAELMLKDINTLIHSCMGKTVVECLQGGGALRDAFEKANPQQQCGNTIGEVKWEITPCWICGSAIPNMGREEDRVHATRGSPPGDKRKHPLSPECEHVFPIAQALCFTGLYEHELFTEMKKTTNNKEKAYVEGLKKEYRWAHRICNQVKNDTHFIKIQGGIFTYNDAAVATLLASILASTEYQWPPLPNTKKFEVDRFAGERRIRGGDIITKHLGGRRTADWATARIEDIGRQVTPILDIVKSKPPHEHAQETVKDFQAYAILKGCVPTALSDVVPVTIYSDRLSLDGKNYPDIFTGQYLGDLAEITADRLHSLSVQALLKKVAIQRGLLSDKQRLLELLGEVTDDVNESADLAYRLNKQNIAAFLLGNGRTEWQTYQKVFYLMYCLMLVNSLRRGLLELITKEPRPEPFKVLVHETIKEVLDKEKASLTGFIKDASGLGASPEAIARGTPKREYSGTFVKWGLGPFQGGGTRRGKRALHTRRRKLPKLL